MNNNGNVCSEACGWCGACQGGTPPNAVCLACGREYVRDEGHIGYDCGRCIHNARHRAERTIENRRVKPTPKAKPQLSVGLTPDEVCR